MLDQNGKDGIMIFDQQAIDPLIKMAIEMASRAHAPITNYIVGAAVLTENGTVIGGCNIENTSLSLTCCAERVALFSAIAQGHNKFTAIAVATKDIGTPCGACRQVLWELCGNIPVITCNFEKKIACTTMGKLLPQPFLLNNNHDSYENCLP